MAFCPSLSLKSTVGLNLRPIEQKCLVLAQKFFGSAQEISLKLIARLFIGNQQCGNKALASILDEFFLVWGVAVWIQCICSGRTVSSKFLLSAFLNWFKLVDGPFGQIYSLVLVHLSPSWLVCRLGRSHMYTVHYYYYSVYYDTCCSANQAVPTS